jgi:hypothetical protein
LRKFFVFSFLTCSKIAIEDSKKFSLVYIMLVLRSGETPRAGGWEKRFEKTPPIFPIRSLVFLAATLPWQGADQ